LSALEKIYTRQHGLKRGLTSGQMAMIAIGSAVGTGLFLGSGIATNLAGPSVLISYGIGAFISLLLMGCLAEMTITHPTTGSFGDYAELYINPYTGFIVRYVYWFCNVLAVGTEVTAMGKYMAFWFLDVAPWIWIVLFAIGLLLINVLSVRTFGKIEYLFSLIKVIAIIFFIIIGGYVVFATHTANIGFHNFYDHGGFFPHGVWGTWNAVLVAIFSYLGLEIIAVATGEAQKPKEAIITAFRATLIRLVIFYLLSITLMLALIPWNEASGDVSPFVLVMEIIGIPGAAGTINFVVLIAALSAMNSQLYVATRMMFSLSRAGLAPAGFGRVSQRGVPVRAFAISSSGIVVAFFLNYFWPHKAFVFMIAISVFGAFFSWMMIFIIHLAFRYRRNRMGEPRAGFQMWLFPVTSITGALLMAGILITTLFTEDFFLTLIVGIPFLLLLTALYFLWYKPKHQSTVGDLK